MVLDVSWALRWMSGTRRVLGENRELLIDLDRQIGDADHGENMDRGFAAVLTALESAECSTIADVMKIVAKTLMSTVGGAAGPLYGTAFLRAAKASATSELSAEGLCDFLAGGLDGIQTRGKAVAGEKTMVDAWLPAVEAARSAVAGGASAAQALSTAAEAARAGCDATLDMKATKGRASYLGERSIGHLDPGAYSSALILEAAVSALDATEGDA